MSQSVGQTTSINPVRTAPRSARVLFSGPDMVLTEATRQHIATIAQQYRGQSASGGPARAAPRSARVLFDDSNSDMALADRTRRNITTIAQYHLRQSAPAAAPVVPAVNPALHQIFGAQIPLPNPAGFRRNRDPRRVFEDRALQDITAQPAAKRRRPSENI